MKKAIIFLVLIFAIFQTRAQMTTTVLYESPDSQINVYIVSQGFTTTSMPTFNTFTDGFLTYLWSVAPYTQNQTRFRIIRVNLPSSENLPAAYFQFENVAPAALPLYISGGTSNPLYNQYQTNECYANFKTRMTNLKPQLPGFNSKSYIIGIFNNNYYTGGGGEYTFATIFANAPSFSPYMYKILTHEFSHTFGLLADEYIRSGSTPYQKNPLDCSILLDGSGNPLVIDPNTFPLFQDRNVTTDKLSIDTIPWKYLISGTSIPACGFNLSCPSNGVGLYEGANYSSNGPSDIKSFRSNETCCMRNVSFPFCQVCSDLLTERIREHECYATNTVTEDFILRHQYITHWRKASNLVTSSSIIGNTISVNYVSGNSILLTNGFNARNGSDFYAHIGDCSTIQLINQYKVTSGTSPTSAPDQKVSSDDSLKTNTIIISPNPSSNLVSINAGNQLIKSVSLYSIEGKILFNQNFVNQESFPLDISTISKGNYIISIETVNGETISKKFIKE